MTFETILKGGEGTSYADMWGGGRDGVLSRENLPIELKNSKEANVAGIYFSRRCEVRRGVEGVTTARSQNHIQRGEG